ncbi:hypothetical protein CROQUDRAFT_653055 [Cronartium quercuum f. sp. fusiforme G11]|uniref:lanosterol synthase n=1 Tax=Cronartium quercuum f. sp. fusiforme G11 TaxID=708437 RepID=A0A9P6NPF1_9BASI|nr:hypothetical protein CROQUDRAFT_653055 [Cronartium quercuum f. sp. fusiforme G11]
MVVLINNTSISATGPLGSTDLTRWHLDTSSDGKVNWSYDSSPERSLGLQSFETKYWLSLHPKGPTLPDPEGNPLKAARNGLEFLKQFQSPDGLVIACYITKIPFSREVTQELARYLANEQRSGKSPRDQGWGLHVAGHSTVFGTALNYVTCRLLGIDAEAPMLVRARATLHALGGATGIPTWGKVWLSLLNVYDWEGVNPIPPEFWLLPDFIPFHPWRWWVHSRQVYLAMSYLWGKRVKADLNPLLNSLRQELYVQPFESIEWFKCRNLVAKEDLYSPHHPVADALFRVLGLWERVCPKSIRHAGISRVHELCKMEDENTNYQALAPVNKVLNMIISWDQDGRDSEIFKLHEKSLHQFLWMTNYTPKLISKERLCQAVDVILSLQNLNGGYGSYELIRGPSWLEWLSPAEIFAKTMVEICYVECTTACLTALSVFNQHFSDYRADEISLARQSAIKFIHQSQRPDGSWYGSWAVCFTYATMFALESLSLNGETYDNSIRVKKACKFLIDRQMKDGGWGESFESCEQDVYIHHQKSQIVQTSWAILGLISVKYPQLDSIKRGCQFIMSRQKSNGEWDEEEESIKGVFNKTTSVTYPNYKFAWTIWALGKAFKQYPEINWNI